MMHLSKDFEVQSYYEGFYSSYAFQMKIVASGYRCEVISLSLIPKKHVYRFDSKGVYEIILDHNAAKTRNSPLYHRKMATFDQKSLYMSP